MHSIATPISRKLGGLATPLVETLCDAGPGDVVRLALDSDGPWFYSVIDDRLPDGSFICRVIEAQSWPSLMLEGIVPGVRYVVSPDRVLSVVKRSRAR